MSRKLLWPAGLIRCPVGAMRVKLRIAERFIFEGAMRITGSDRGLAAY